MVGHGRVVLAVDSVLWTMKMLDYMSVHPRLGPYITMAGKMVSFFLHLLHISVRYLSRDIKIYVEKIGEV